MTNTNVVVSLQNPGIITNPTEKRLYNNEKAMVSHTLVTPDFQRAV